jgi:hypothetical protein
MLKAVGMASMTRFGLGGCFLGCYCGYIRHSGTISACCRCIFQR